MQPDCEPPGPGDGPGRVHFLAVEGERNGPDRRAEVHHVREGWAHDGGGAVRGELRADRAVHAADRARDHFEHRRRRDDELHGAGYRERRERKPGGAGYGSAGVRLLAVDGERNASGRRAEVHHVHDLCGHDGGGGIHAEHRHAGRAVGAADRARDHFEHRRRRDDGLHGAEYPERDGREPGGPGDGPGRLHFLAVDGERRGADRRAEGDHVHGHCGYDGGGTVHAEHLRADRAVGAADRAEHRLEHHRRRDDELHVAQRRLRDEREPPGAGDGPGRLHFLAVDGERRGAGRRAEVDHVRDVCGYHGRGAVRSEHHADRAVHAADRAEHRFEHRPRRHDELRSDRRRSRDEREPSSPGDGPGRVHVLLLDSERDASDCGREGYHAHDAHDGPDGGGGLHAEHLHADGAFHAADRDRDHFEQRRRRDDELLGARRRIRYERQPAGPGDGRDRVVHLLAVDLERRGADSRAAVPRVHDDRGRDGCGAVHHQHLHADRAVAESGRRGFHRRQPGGQQRPVRRDDGDPAADADVQRRHVRHAERGVGRFRQQLPEVAGERRRLQHEPDHHRHRGERHLHGGVSDADGRIPARGAVHASDRIEHRFVHGP